jgi:hypothetical protein
MAFFDGCSGKAEDAYVGDFSIIPNNTTARAMIKTIQVMETSNKYTGAQKFIEISWQLLDGDFKNREVKQKIKCFEGDESALKRARNMLLLVMKLCQFQLSHELEPTTFDLLPLTGKMLGIKIREWSMEKKDGSGTMEGNFVSEVHPLDDKWVTETGVKSVSKVHKPTQQQNVPDISESDDLPF